MLVHVTVLHRPKKVVLSTDVHLWSVNLKFGLCFFCFFSNFPDFLRRPGSDLPRQTSEPLHQRHPEGDAAEVLPIAVYAQHGRAEQSVSRTSSTSVTRYHCAFHTLILTFWFKFEWTCWSSSGNAISLSDGVILQQEQASQSYSNRTSVFKIRAYSICDMWFSSHSCVGGLVCRDLDHIKCFFAYWRHR